VPSSGSAKSGVPPAYQGSQPQQVAMLHEKIATSRKLRSEEVGLIPLCGLGAENQSYVSEGAGRARIADSGKTPGSMWIQPSSHRAVSLL